MKKIVVITCSICGWFYELDFEKVESGELKPAEPVSIISKHLKEEHKVEPTIAMRRKPTIVN